MVGQRTLDPFIMVRIHVSQPRRAPQPNQRSLFSYIKFKTRMSQVVNNRRIAYNNRVPTIEKVDLRRLITVSAREEELSARRRAFLQAGLSFDKVAGFEAQRPTLYSPIALRGRLNGLQELGFNPHKIPRMIKLVPTILGYDPKTIEIKIAGLQDRGFTNPRKMIEGTPTVLVRSLETIDDRISVIKELGFSDPLRVVEGFPGIFGYSRDSINKKFAELQVLGFTDLQGMIEKCPNIFGYSLKNIKRRLRLLSGLIQLYNRNRFTDNVQFTAQELMKNHTALFSAKIDKIVILARVLGKIAQDPQDITNTAIQGLLFANLEDVLVAVDMMPDSENVSPGQLLKMARKVKAAEYTKDKKRRLITEGLQHDPKIKQRYLRGYPEK